ncbi:MAG: GNAT family N-acetyltransferase [Rubripirellula sp.]
MPVTTKRVDYHDAADCRDLLIMLSEYARYETGQDPPSLQQLPKKLAEFPTAFSVLAYEMSDPNRPVGLINCFFGFSTFQGRRLVNVHDVVVTESCRGQGVAARMMDEVKEIARANDCCRLTLEVYADNEPAIRAYHKYGFIRDPSHPDTDVWFLRKPLD